MQYTCPKCGQESEMSLSELRAQKGSVVCPRCLTVYKVDYPKDSDDDEDETPPPVPTRHQPQPSPKPFTQPLLRTATIDTYCNHCGALISAGRSYCTQCGCPVTGAVARGANPTTTMPPRHQNRDPISFVGSETTVSQSHRGQQPQRNSSAKRKKKKTASKPLSYWGCAAYTILITIILLLLYYMAGNLLNS